MDELDYYYYYYYIIIINAGTSVLTNPSFYWVLVGPCDSTVIKRLLDMNDIIRHHFLSFTQTNHDTQYS